MRAKLIDGQCSSCGAVIEGALSGAEHLPDRANMRPRARKGQRESDIIFAALQRVGARYILDPGSPDKPMVITVEDLELPWYQHLVDIVMRFDPISGDLLEAPDIRAG